MSEKRKEILTSDKNHLTLFEDKININKDLLKWKKAEGRIDGNNNKKSEKKVRTYAYTDTDTSTSTLISNTSSNSIQAYLINVDNEIVASTTDGGSTGNHNLFEEDSQKATKKDEDEKINMSTSWVHLYKTPEGISFDDLASAGISDLNKMIAEEKIKYVMGGYGSFGSTVYNSSYITHVPTESKNKELRGPIAKIKNFFINLIYKPEEKEENKQDLMDALKFFSLIKATSKESAETYRDRVGKYLTAIHDAVLSGQVSLQEKLLRGLITNKYESLLYAEGYYYVITEKQVVDFVKKCEKGIALDYIKNYTNPIPHEVIEKIDLMNQLEIFDNYVVLHYDPTGKKYKETAQEEAKRKDPILFGVIAGSNKLYYITDWVDETCDLTLDKFVDILSIDKEVLNMDYDEKSKKAMSENTVNKKKKNNKK